MVNQHVFHRMKCKILKVFQFFLQKQVPYFVKLRVTNCAGLFVTLETTPVLFDENLPVAGQVKDGLDFTSDLLWFNDTSKIEGMNLSVRFVFYWYLFLKSRRQILKF